MAEFEIPLLSDSGHQVVSSSFGRSDIIELSDGKSGDTKCLYRCALIGVLLSLQSANEISLRMDLKLSLSTILCFMAS